jgi:DnaJ-class molecular chaperone
LYEADEYLGDFSPDKNPGVKGVHERFARLSVIAEILKGEESRKRSVSFHS